MIVNYNSTVVHKVIFVVRYDYGVANYESRELKDWQLHEVDKMS